MGGRGIKSSRKLVNAYETEPSIDRLSGLPEAMLCHILSFLTIKESVATSILARRWRYLWTNFTTLDLNFQYAMCKRTLDVDYDDYFSHNVKHGIIHGHSRIVYAWTGCSDIVNRLLLMQNGQVLNTFVLYYNRFDFTDSQIDSWMTVAIARGVKNIGIHSWDELPDTRGWRDKVPVSLFRCETLVVLGLTSCSVCILPNGKISMPNLKELLLVDISYGDNETLPRLLSGCPLLEKLFINQEKFEWITVKYLPILIKASIHFLENDELACSWPVDILNGFSNAKSLRLFYDGEFNDSKSEDLTSKFTNLIKLKLLCSDCRLLIKFLEKADNLKHLAVHRVYEVATRHWQEPLQVLSCLLSHLETVVVDLVSVDDNTFLLVRYILKNAKVLKDMSVGLYYGLSVIDKEILQDKVFSLERGSPECRIGFTEMDCSSDVPF